MAALEIKRYALDPTGTNPDNAVQGEIKTLSAAQIRAAAPMYGPFYSESLQLWDNGNGRLLYRGTDYQVVELLQDATMKYGKEIAQMVLILNDGVSSQLRINYQVLGGLYQNDSSNLVEVYDAYMKDNRPVDWGNVLNRPVEYTPTLHRHLLEDVYGFEALVVALERIRNAIVLADVPAFEELITWVKTRGMTIDEFKEGRAKDKFITGEVLSYILKRLGLSLPSTGNTMMDLYNACCLYDPKIKITARSMMLAGE